MDECHAESTPCQSLSRAQLTRKELRSPSVSGSRSGHGTNRMMETHIHALQDQVRQGKPAHLASFAAVGICSDVHAGLAGM